WNVLVGGRATSGSKPKIWSTRMVLSGVLLLPSTSDWYQASPKPGKPETGEPSACWLLRCTLNRSNWSPGLNPDVRSTSESFGLLLTTETVAVGGVTPSAAMQGMKRAAGKSENDACSGDDEASWGNTSRLARGRTAASGSRRRRRWGLFGKWGMDSLPVESFRSSVCTGASGRGVQVRRNFR